LLCAGGKATLATIYGGTIELTLKGDPKEVNSKILRHKHSDGTEAAMKVGPLDCIYIDYSGMLALANQLPWEYALREISYRMA
jgi:hypothetical protein